MKKVLFVAAFATLVAAGCQKTEVINPTVGTPMSFSTGMSKLTKTQGTVDAENKGQKNLEAQDFSVWAYADPQSDFSTSTLVNSTTKIYDEMENLLIECKSASADAVVGNGTETEPETPAVAGTWSTGKEYYWPGEGKNLRFFAVSADGAWLRPTGDDATCPVVIDYATPSITINNFEVKAQPVKNASNEVIKTAANEDLMVADYVMQNQSDKVVDLTFRHTLAKVEFVFKTLAATGNDVAPDVWVQSLMMEDLQYKGTLKATPKANETDIVWDFLWEQNKTDLTDFTDDWTKEATYIDGVEAAAAADKTAMKLTISPATFTTWLMLPQDITADNKVTITYVINKRQFTSVFPLNGDKNTTISKWGHNQHIKYTVTLAPNVITFAPTVQDWATATPVEHQN